MPKFITEDNIEQAIIKRLESDVFDYDIIKCDPDPNKRDDLNDGTNRESKKQCVLPKVLKNSLIKINPNVELSIIDDIVDELSRDYSGSELVDTNYKMYNKIRQGITVNTISNGENDFEIINLIDFDNPENNTFTAVSQMWIQGRFNYRRPDVLVFVNGLPLVFIELKNSTEKVEVAYKKNLKDYLNDIPNLFVFNQICVLSNGLETRLGAFNATYNFFFEWLKTDSEKEIVDRERIRNDGTSIEFFINGLLRKEKLIDYIENFVLFDNKTNKIIAKNHQYIGVNNLIDSFNNRKELQGKLGVFWHTQGSGKSYSMVMFVRKVRRKIDGNYTFLIVTDRDDLDTQIHKTFVRTEVIGPKEETQPKNAEQLRDFLIHSEGKTLIFTLIHKFGYDKTKQYPVLSTRDDLIVLVDEAHRTQYKSFGENMHKGLPNANFIAFTGTPLLGSKRLTNQWFGDYVSEYNFAQSVEDGSTVPLFYSRRVPTAWLQNNFLDDDVLDIIEEENLNEDEQRLLENSTSKLLEVIKREDRLDKVAKDIAHHFPRRGFLGKGMVVSVDKYTAVKMYDLVQHYWTEEKKNLITERNNARTQEERDNITRIINYMDSTEMAVIVSEEADEVKKFADKNLDITKHRSKMNEITPEGVDIEDRFKDPYDRLRLVFVCAMWLTGFDVPSLSTMYLDKPMKSHTLMQAIARANRVFPDKPCGIIVDYVNVFKYMKQALSDYGRGTDGNPYPAKDIDELLVNLDAVINEADIFLKGIGINLDDIIKESDTLDRLSELADAFNIIVDNDDYKDRFKVLTNTMVLLYEASKPEVFEKGWFNPKFSPLSYLYGLMNNTINNQKVEAAKLKMAQVLDNSIESENLVCEPEFQYGIVEGKVINLAKLDIEELRKEINRAPYKAVEIDNLKEYLKQTLEQMINRNCTRIQFAERFKNIIDRYNAGSTESEDYYEQLVELIEELKKEDNRAVVEGLGEEELEIYDLLVQGKKLTKAEEQKVKLAAKNLYNKISEKKEELLIVDWYKDEQPIAKVKDAIQVSLDNDLPECYDKESFNSKTSLLLNHFIDMGVQGYGWISNALHLGYC